MICRSMSASRWGCADILDIIALLCFSGCFAGLMVPTTPVDAAMPTICPTRDQYVPYNSMVNVTFSCAVESGSRAIWEVRGTQIFDQQRKGFENIGVFIHEDGNYSTLSVSFEARQQYKEVPLVCVSNQDTKSVKGMTYKVVTFDEPETPANLKLVLSSGEPVLEWKRSQNVPTEVEITYMVTINSSESGLVVFENITSSPALSLLFLEVKVVADRGHCEMFEFTVQATNDAGPGTISEPVLATIPFSPDVTNISRHLTVKEVRLQPLRVTISFPPVMPCSANFTLRNYSVSVRETPVYTVSPESPTFSLGDDGSILLELAPAGVTVDDSFNLTVTACSDITCRTSDPVVFNTTDVQLAEAVFFQNNLYLHCTFAVNSTAKGCVIRLSVSGGNDTDEFTVYREAGYSCNVTNNRLEAYGDITVSDLEKDGMVGNVSLVVVPKEVVTSTEFKQTECTLPEVGAPARDGIIIGSIIGSIIGGFVLLTVSIIIICLCIMQWRRRKLRLNQDYDLDLEGMESSGEVRGGPPPFPSSDPAPSSQESTENQGNRIQPDSGDRQRLEYYYDTKWSADKKNVVITIKLKELVQSIMKSESKYSRLKVKFE